MTVDLNHDELVLLIQLVNVHMVQLANTQLQQGRKQEEFEAQLFKKLYDAHMDEMMILKQQQNIP
jgi:hypothetical protein